MNPRQLRPTMSLESAFEELAYTAARLQESSHAIDLRQPFTDLREQWWNTLSEEYKHRFELIAANVRITMADDSLDEIVDAVAHAVRGQSGNKSDHPLYVQYFRSSTPSKLKRPVLGSELETVRGWEASLQSSSVSDLNQIRPRLTAAVTLADQAIAHRARTEQANTTFRTTGLRAKFFDDFNRQRQETHAALAQIARNDTSGKIPANFADSFFRKDSDDTSTVESLQEQVTSTQKQLQLLTAQLSELQAQQAKQEQLDKERLAKELALAEAEKLALEAAQRAEALRAELKK